MIRILKSLGSLLWAAISGHQNHNVTRLAASIGFYGILSLAPLLVILVTVAGFVFGNDAAQGIIVDQLTSTLGPTAAKAVQSMIANASQSRASVPATIAAVIILFFSASRLIGDIRNSLNTIWGVQGHGGIGFRGYLIGKGIDLLMIFGLAILMLATLAASIGVHAITHYFNNVVPLSPGVLQLISIFFSLVVDIVVLAVIFRALPNIDLDWRDVGLSSLLSAVLFTIGNYAVGFYLGRSSLGSVFGAAGSFVVIMVWIYYSAIIVLFGVELTRADRLRRQRRKHDRQASPPVAAAQPHPDQMMGGGQSRAEGAPGDRQLETGPPGPPPGGAEDVLPPEPGQPVEAPGSRRATRAIPLLSALAGFLTASLTVAGWLIIRRNRTARAPGPK
jgi:membrane protein